MESFDRAVPVTLDQEKSRQEREENPISLAALEKEKSMEVHSSPSYNSSPTSLSQVSTTSPLSDKKLPTGDGSLALHHLGTSFTPIKPPLPSDTNSRGVANGIDKISPIKQLDHLSPTSATPPLRYHHDLPPRSDTPMNLLQKISEYSSPREHLQRPLRGSNLQNTLPKQPDENMDPSKLTFLKKQSWQSFLAKSSPKPQSLMREESQAKMSAVHMDFYKMFERMDEFTKKLEEMEKNDNGALVEAFLQQYLDVMDKATGENNLFLNSISDILQHVESSKIRLKELSDKLENLNNAEQNLDQQIADMEEEIETIQGRIASKRKSVGSSVISFIKNIVFFLLMMIIFVVFQLFVIGVYISKIQNASGFTEAEWSLTEVVQTYFQADWQTYQTWWMRALKFVLMQVNDYSLQDIPT